MGQEKSSSYVGMGQGEMCLVSQEERGNGLRRTSGCMSVGLFGTVLRCRNRSGARRGGRTTGVHEHRFPGQTQYSEAGGSGKRVLPGMTVVSTTL